MGKRDLGNQLVGSGMHNGGGKVQYGWYAGCGSEFGRVRIGGWGMGLAYINYVCVCCENANVRMPSRVLVGCLVQSRGVFAMGQNIESRGNFYMTFLFCLAWKGLSCVA